MAGPRMRLSMNDKRKLMSSIDREKKETARNNGEAVAGNRRRDFLRQLGGVTAATLTFGAGNLAPLAERAAASSKPVRAAGKRRAEECYCRGNQAQEHIAENRAWRYSQCARTWAHRRNLLPQECLERA